MAFEYLDLENKMYAPTQQLLNQLQINLTELYETIRQSLLHAHNEVAVLGREFYDAPLDTTSRWYDQAIIYGTDLYAVFFDVVLPKAEANYQEILIAASDWTDRTRETISFMVENPSQVTVEAIQTMTENLTTVGNVSMEMVQDLQNKTAEIVVLLLRHPWQTLETATMELLSDLLNGYFELVSALLSTM